MSKFNQKWASQTDLGKLYGMSAVALGKELESLGLRDVVSKAPTQIARDGGWCVSTPLKNEKVHWMWNRAKLLETFDSKGILQLGEYHKIANELMAQLKKAQKHIDEGSKLGYLMQEAAYAEVPKSLRDEVDAILKSNGVL